MTSPQASRRRRPAVLVVDVVEAYFGGPGASDERQVQALSAARSVVTAARQAGVPVIHTRPQFRPDGLDGGHYFARNPDLAQFAGIPPRPRPEVEPLPTELVVPRSYPSAFFGTSIAATLRGGAIDQVILVGATTSGNIRIAAIDALQHGFVPMVVTDAVIDGSTLAHEDALRDLEDLYADVNTADQVRDRLASITSVGS